MPQSESELAVKYLKLAASEAEKGVQSKEGRPFGAVIVRNGTIIVSAHNELFKLNDPTAHAEVVAIRKASAKLNSPDLSGCVMYSSCEPCPMCFCASLWAGLEKVYYAVDQFDADKAGFSDAKFYSIICDDVKRKAYASQVNVDEGKRPFEIWERQTTQIQP